MPHFWSVNFSFINDLSLCFFWGGGGLVKHQSSSKALLPPTAFRFPQRLTDLSSLFYQGSPSFFSAVEDDDVIGVCVRACACCFQTWN